METDFEGVDLKSHKQTLSFSSQMFGQNKEPDPIALDHCYSKPWNGHPDSLRARPARMLFMKGIPFHPGLDGSRQDKTIDVETVTSKVIPPYDSMRALTAMNECDRFLVMNALSTGLKNSEDWEDILKRTSVSWTSWQNNLYNKVVKVIQAQRLAALAYEGTQNEPLMRRLAVDKSATRTRHIFGSISWDMKQLQWLHHILTDYLDKPHLAIYLDILQSLKTKVPNLIDKLLVGAKASENFQNLLKRPWDPATTLFTQQKPKKLPGSPILVMTPGEPPLGGVGHPRRLKFWHSQLCALGKVVTLNLHISPNMAVRESLETVMLILKNKLMELKKTFPLRPIVLVGWTVGALIAYQIALIEAVSAVVCLGFPLTGVLGSRGDLDDPLLESRTPTLFVVGQNACTCSVDDVEDFRERMRAESGLVVIGGADDHLRINRLKKKLEGVTQAMVDRCIVDEIGDFLAMVMTQPLEDSPQFFPGPEKVKKEAKVKRKQKNKEIIVKGTKAPKRQYNKKQKNKAISITPVERMSPSSPGSSTTDTSSTCSLGDNISWKQPKRGVGRPPSMQLLAKRRRMNSQYAEAASVEDTPPSTRRSGKPSDFFNNYLQESQRISVNIGSMSSLGNLRQSPPSGLVKISPPTIPSAGIPPKLGSFEAPRGFIARMDVPYTSAGPGSMLSSAPRMLLPRPQGKTKNVTFKTMTTMTPILSTSAVAGTSNTPSSVTLTSSSSELSTSRAELKPATHQLLVQKKIVDMNQIQSLILKNPAKPPQPVIPLLSSGNKNLTKAETSPFILGGSQSSPKTSLLQSALSAHKTATSTSLATTTTTPRKMQIITFLKPPPNTVVAKPTAVIGSEREAADVTSPKGIRTYGDMRLNRQLAAMKQQQQLVNCVSKGAESVALSDSLSHLSSGAQDAVFALTQLSGGTGMSSPESDD